MPHVRFSNPQAIERQLVVGQVAVMLLLWSGVLSKPELEVVPSMKWLGLCEHTAASWI